MLELLKRAFTTRYVGMLEGKWRGSGWRIGR